VGLLTSEGDDSTTPDGRLLISIKAALAAPEAEKVSVRRRDEIAQRIESGHYQAGCRLYGYANAQCSIIEEREAVHFREACAMLIQGATLTTIVHYLNANARPFKGKPARTFTPGTVLKRMLSNPVYAGFIKWQGETIGRSEHIAAIIDEVTHERVLAALAARSIPMPRHHNVRKYVASGFIYCGNPGCGTAMVAEITGTTRHRWACRGCRRIFRDFYAVNKAIDTYVATRITLTEDIQTPVVDIHTQGRAHIAELEGRLASICADYANGDIDRADFLPMQRAMRQKLTEAQSELTTALRDEARTAPKPTGDLAAIWASTDPSTLDARRAILAAYVSGVYILPTVKRGAGTDWSAIDIHGTNITENGRGGR
jgi:hypothetical protein